MGVTYSFEEWLALIDEYYASLSTWKKFKLRVRYFPVALPYFLVDLKSEGFRAWLRAKEDYTSRLMQTLESKTVLVTRFGAEK